LGFSNDRFRVPLAWITNRRSRSTCNLNLPFDNQETATEPSIGSHVATRKQKMSIQQNCLKANNFCRSSSERVQVLEARASRADNRRLNPRA
jgi:hypothetical protein